MSGTSATMPGRTAAFVAPVDAKAGLGTRIGSIDALRGFVMLLMLLDHTRETFLLYANVGDPVNANIVDPVLFFTRLTSTICAPTFVALTGLSAYLYGLKHSKREVSWFLFSRGLFLMVLELTVVAYAWPTQPLGYPPPLLSLQVIWAIGVTMIALAALIHLPRAAQIALGAAIVCLHNLFDTVILTPESPFYVIWAELHQRSSFLFDEGRLTVRTSYPVLPWIGLILLGYVSGPMFGGTTMPADRIRRLRAVGVGLIVGFVVLRWLNVYGDAPWFQAETPLRTVMSFLALTKYPPSLLFLMSTIGVGCLILALFESRQDSRMTPYLACFGAAPMFFYIVHLYVLKIIYNLLYLAYGPTNGALFGFAHIWMVWLAAALLCLAMYRPTRWFAELKQSRRDIWWLKYL